MPFGPLEIEYDERVLRPRPWTEQQGRWAAELLAAAPPGPVLELCCGAGHIGLLAIALEPRPLVAVDDAEAACGYARSNAVAAGLGHLVDVRRARLEQALAPEESFVLVVADPPWVPSPEVGRHPQDPSSAIDGGPDGLDVARACLRVAAAHLAPGGQVLVQLGSRAQASALAAEAGGLALRDVRDGEGGVVALFSVAADATMAG